MKVRLLGQISGTRNGQNWPARGEVLDVPDDEGASLCATGMAQPVADRNAGVETATPPADDVETREAADEPAESEEEPTGGGLTTQNGPASRRGRPAKQG